MKLIALLFALTAASAQAATFHCGNIPETETSILLSTGGQVEFDGKKYDAMKITLRTKEGFAPKSDWYLAQVSPGRVSVEYGLGMGSVYQFDLYPEHKKLVLTELYYAQDTNPDVTPLGVHDCTQLD
jgi:hypothetical protein